MVPVGPMRYQIGIGDQNPGRVLVGAKDADRLAGLNQQGLVFFQFLQAGDDLVKILPCAGRATYATVNHKLMRVFGHIRVQVVHQHPHWRFGQPTFGRDLGAGRWVDVAAVLAVEHHRSPVQFANTPGRARGANRLRISFRRESAAPARPLCHIRPLSTATRITPPTPAG